MPDCTRMKMPEKNVMRFLYQLLRRLYLFFFPKKKVLPQISYSEWLELLRVTAAEGFECEEYRRLCQSFPEQGEAYYRTDGARTLALEMESYANKRLPVILNDFQDRITSALWENDSLLIEAAFRNLKADLINCMFFERLAGFPQELSERLSSEITEVIAGWQTEYGRLLREQFESFPAGSLGEELLWLFMTHPPAEMLKKE